MPTPDSKGKAKASTTIAPTTTTSSARAGADNNAVPAPENEGYSYTRNLLLAKLLRLLGPIGFFWHVWCISPRGIRASSTERIKMRDGHEIAVHIYRPASESTSKSRGQTQEEEEEEGRRVCVVNFHGGGWTIGYPTDDARWARWCVQHLGAVFVSVDYRLAPEWPWPTPVRDCIDATKWIHDQADRLGVNREKVVTSGFSAGGCLAVTTALGLAQPSLDPSPSPSPSPSRPSPSSSHSIAPAPDVRHLPIRGIISFYPLLDFSAPRSEKIRRAKNPSSLRPLPGWMTRLFDTSYLPPPSSREGRPVIDRTHPLISPLLAPDGMLDKLPNTHLCLCERDVLGLEVQEMADKLSARLDLGKRKGEVVSRWVKGASHGWDKPPHPVTQSVMDEYDAAVPSVRRWCE